PKAREYAARAVKHTLGSLLSYFERDASVYIGDAEIYPELASEMAKYRKPSGASLVLASDSSLPHERTTCSAGP
ncbi:MAG: hypothetical protein OK474_09530, partial [Thaumarchaeota archaeon]|nr:hypothetical protein [Nitrososphaerota archaeon]